MNRIKKTIGLTVLALIALAVPAAAQTDVSGTWTIEVQGPEGPAVVVATLAQEGADVSGSFEVDMFGTVRMEGGKMEGDTLSFELQLDFEGLPLVIEVSAVIDGDEMTGSFYVADFGNMPFAGTRSGP